MEKEIKKHLDNPNLRGMVTTKEIDFMIKNADVKERNTGLEYKLKMLK